MLGSNYFYTSGMLHGSWGGVSEPERSWGVCLGMGGSVAKKTRENTMELLKVTVKRVLGESRVCLQDLVCACRTESDN